eukprot:scaffold13799_cov200-Alexandrium_tamarense.AAC.5
MSVLLLATGVEPTEELGGCQVAEKVSNKAKGEDVKLLMVWLGDIVDGLSINDWIGLENLQRCRGGAELWSVLNENTAALQCPARRVAVEYSL